MTHQERARRQQVRFQVQHSASPDRPFEFVHRDGETAQTRPFYQDGTRLFFATAREADRFGWNQGYKFSEFAVVEVA
jgi:hypothetical protein